MRNFFLNVKTAAALAVFITGAAIGFINISPAYAACEVTVRWGTSASGQPSASQLSSLKPRDALNGMVSYRDCPVGWTVFFAIRENSTAREIAKEALRINQPQGAIRDLLSSVPADAKPGESYHLEADVTDILGQIMLHVEASSTATVAGAASTSGVCGTYPSCGPNCDADARTLQCLGRTNPCGTYPSCAANCRRNDATLQCVPNPAPPSGAQTTVGDAGCEKLKRQFENFTGEAPQVLVEQCQGPGKAIGRGVRIVLGVAAAMAVLFLVIAAIRYMTASGNTSTMESAKKSMTWAGIGLGAILLAYAIVTIISGLVLDGSLF